jgi:hypothetical protein
MKVFLVDLESIPTRYTCEWKTHVPQLLESNGFDVEVIEGDLTIPDATTPGAFLNFGGTNMYKATQLHKLAELFTLGKIEAGDHIVFTDAWHPAIINVKYMSELLNIPVLTHGLWHAGSYDPNDFLGRLVGDKPWIRHAEQSFIEAFDFNWLATDAHFELIGQTYTNSFYKTGWPMEYTKGMIDSVKFTDKKKIIVFPHRVAPEKRVDLFEALSQRPELIEYEFRIPMLEGLTKEQYHILLQSAKFAVSFAEQETLGISMYEAACAGAMPIVPDRLSYIEMYSDIFKHDDTIDHVVDIILSAEQHDMTFEIDVQAQRLHTKFFSATNLINKLKEYNEQRTA